MALKKTLDDSSVIVEGLKQKLALLEQFLERGELDFSVHEATLSDLSSLFERASMLPNFDELYSVFLELVDALMDVEGALNPEEYRKHLVELCEKLSSMLNSLPSRSKP